MHLYVRISNFFRRQVSFRAFLVMAAVVTLLPLHVALVIVVLRDIGNHRRALENELRTITRMTTAAVDADVRRWLSDLEPIASLAVPGRTPRSQMQGLLAGHLGSHPLTSWLAVVDRDGTVLAQAGGPDIQATDLLLRGIQQPGGLAGTRAALSGMLADPADGTPLVGIAMSGQGAQRPQAATVLALRRLDNINLILAEDEGSGIDIALLDGNGIVMAATNRSQVGKPYSLPLPPMPSGSQVPIRRVRVREADTYVAVATAGAAGWRVVATAPAEVVDDPVRTEMLALFWMGGLLLLPILGMVLLGRYLSHRVESLAEAARAVSTETDAPPGAPMALREIELVQQALRRAVDAVRDQARARGETATMKEALGRAERMEGAGQMMAGLAHDFGNLIFAIGGNLEVLRRSLDQRAPEQKLIEPSLRMAEEASTLISLMSAAGRPGEEARLVDVGADLVRTGELLRHVAGRSVTMTIETAPGPMVCRLDPKQLRSALLNLVVNAQKAMPRGGRISISCAPETLDQASAAAKGLPAGAYARLTVSDTGVGMPPQVSSRIFEPFFTTRQGEAGTGFGLSIVHGFVRAAGGQVEVESAEGQGATFRLYFPLVPDAVADGAAAEEQPHPHA